MNKKYFVLLVLLAFLLMQNKITFAQIPPIFFLNQAISSAIQNDPFIQQKRVELKLSPSEIAAISTSQLNPFFTFGLNPGVQGYKFGFAKTFELGGLKQKRIGIAKLRNELQLLELEKQMLIIKDKVRGAYVTHYINHEKLKNLKNNLQLIKELIYQGCCKNIIEQKQADLVILKLKNDIRRAELSLLESKIALEELTGESIEKKDQIDAPNRIPGTLEKLFGKKFERLEKTNEEQFKKIAYKNRPEIKENEKEIELSLKQEKLAKVKRLPLMILESGWELVTPPEININNFYIEGDIELPILYRNNDEIKAAKDRQNQYKNNLDETKKDIAIEIKNTFEYLLKSQKNLDSYEYKILPEMENLISFFIENYKNGKYSFSELLQAKQINTEINNGYFRALKDYQDAISDLERVLGLGVIAENKDNKVKTKNY